MLTRIALFILFAAGPVAAAPPRAGVVLVASNAEHVLLIVDAATGREVGRLATGEGPHEVAVSPDGRLAYVANCGTGGGKPGPSTITVVDVAKRSVRATLDIAPHNPHDLKVSRDGKSLWVTSASKRALVEVDAATGAVRKVWEHGQVGGWMLTSTPDDRKLYAANYEGGSVSIVDRSRGTVRTIPLAEGEMGIDVSPDGRELWVSNASTGGVTVFDTRTDAVLATFSTGGKGPLRLKFTPDGRRVLMPHDDDKTLVVVDAARRAVVARVALPAAPKVLAVSGDGATAYLSNPDDDGATAVDLRTLTIAARLPAVKKPDGIAWAPAR
jgi:YVTN family beta-propeller protein